MLWQQHRGEHRFPFSFLFKTHRCTFLALQLLPFLKSVRQKFSLTPSLHISEFFPQKACRLKFKTASLRQIGLPCRKSDQIGNNDQDMQQYETLKQSNMRLCWDIRVQISPEWTKNTLISPFRRPRVCAGSHSYTWLRITQLGWIGFDKTLDLSVLHQYQSYYQRQK